MSTVLPVIEHNYKNHILDSTRWQSLIARDDDVFVVSSLKSGTTWMQMIVLNLIFAGHQGSINLAASPWVDSRIRPIDEVTNLLEAQQHRRCIKTHLPLDGLPYYMNPKYIIVNRDPRDVFMSLWNHYRNYTSDWLQLLNSMPNTEGRRFPKCPDDIRDFWKMWISRGWFEWEREGYPFWSNLRHTQTWWTFRHLPNLLFVHFNDLLADLKGEVHRVAHFLEIDLPEEKLSLIADSCTFHSMKQKAEQIMPNMTAIEGGAQTFFNKGTNGRWRGILTEADLELYNTSVKREITPECLSWLEHEKQARAEGR